MRRELACIEESCILCKASSFKALRPDSVILSSKIRVGVGSRITDGMSGFLKGFVAALDGDSERKTAGNVILMGRTLEIPDDLPDSHRRHYFRCRAASECCVLQITGVAHVASV